MSGYKITLPASFTGATTPGSVFYVNASGYVDQVPPTVTGTVLISDGVGTNPRFGTDDRFWISRAASMFISPIQNTYSYVASGGAVGGAKWLGCVHTTNGKIVFIPNSASSVLVVETISGTSGGTIDTVSSIALGGAGNYAAGVLGETGKAYGIPFNTTNVLVIDSVFLTAVPTSFSVPTPVAAGNYWLGGVYVGGGRIICSPYDAESILSLDTNTSTSAVYGSLTTSAGKWSGCVLAPNGKVYFIPFNSTVVMIFTPATNTVDTTTITGIAGASKYMGGVLGPDNKIYCVPYNATNVMIIDTATDTVDIATISGLSASTAKWAGGILTPNNDIICMPHSVTSTLVIRVTGATATTSTFPAATFTGGGTQEWWGGVIAANGRIYMTPYNSTNVAAIEPEKTSTTIELIGCMSSFRNKY